MRFVLLIVITTAALGQTIDPGRTTFEKTCAKCHGGDGNGGEMARGILYRLPSRDDQQLIALIREGLPQQGMPPVRVEDSEMAALVRYLRTIQRQGRPLVRRSVTLVNGKTLEGVVLGEGFDDLQIRAADGIHLLRRSGERYREVTSEVNWPHYNGDPRGNRYTTMTQINKKTVVRLAPKWIFPIPAAGRPEATPQVVDGVMYLAAANECFALDAGSGRLLWRYQRPHTKGIPDMPETNRGVSVAASRVFMETDNAHIIALDRFTGELLWDTELADYRQNYYATSAPLTAGNLVIAGVGGGENGANGFLTAHDQATGKEVWRFWTVPKRGDPGSETWGGKDIDHGGAPTWFTGSYDPDLDVVYWPTGNPGKEYDGSERMGDNLYSDSILALDRQTGKLKWYYQFTPHDLWDWDATETPVLIDADWEGRPRKLLLHADRNGFFYVFDRMDGKLLLGKQFLRNVNWATGIAANGRPMIVPGMEPNPQGKLVCPSQDGATNWFSPSFNPGTGLYYVQTFEKCAVYTLRDTGPWEAGKTYLGGSQRTSQDPKPVTELKALDYRTGKVVWTLPQPGPANGWGGTLTTATGLVIFGEESGSLMAVDAANGRVLWSFPTNHGWKASPMTYMFDSKQYVAVTAGSIIMAFAILE